MALSEDDKKSIKIFYLINGDTETRKKIISYIKYDYETYSATTKSLQIIVKTKETEDVVIVSYLKDNRVLETLSFPEMRDLADTAIQSKYYRNTVDLHKSYSAILYDKLNSGVIDAGKLQTRLSNKFYYNLFVPWVRDVIKKICQGHPFDVEDLLKNCSECTVYLKSINLINILDGLKNLSNTGYIGSYYETYGDDHDLALKEYDDSCQLISGRTGPTRDSFAGIMQAIKEYLPEVYSHFFPNGRQFEPAPIFCSKLQQRFFTSTDSIDSMSTATKPLQSHNEEEIKQNFHSIYKKNVSLILKNLDGKLNLVIWPNMKADEINLLKSHFEAEYEIDIEKSDTGGVIFSCSLSDLNLALSNDLKNSIYLAEVSKASSTAISVALPSLIHSEEGKSKASVPPVLSLTHSEEDEIKTNFNTLFKKSVLLICEKSGGRLGLMLYPWMENNEFNVLKDYFIKEHEIIVENDSYGIVLFKCPKSELNLALSKDLNRSSYQPI